MSDNSCPNCQTRYGEDDMFCENCGYDFITGSLPIDASSGAPTGVATPLTPPTPASHSGGAPDSSAAAAGGESAGGESVVAPSVLSPDGDDPNGTASAATSGSEGAGSAGAPLDVPRLTIAVTVDKEFFDAVVNDGEIDFPDPIPPDQDLDLAGSELHIGRTSESRAIHPDIDVAALTGDQAVSSRHAVLRVANDGTYTLVDVGSTNGTFLDDVDSEAITHGVPIEVKAGQALYVGAWTRLTIRD